MSRGNMSGVNMSRGNVRIPCRFKNFYPGSSNKGDHDRGGGLTRGFTSYRTVLRKKELLSYVRTEIITLA